MTKQELEILKKVINNSIENKEENKFSRETLFKYYNLLKEAGHEIVLTSDVDRVIAEKAIEVFVKDIEMEAKQMKEVHIYRGKDVFEKVEKINGEYIFFEHEEENGETPNIAYPISELDEQVRDYKKRGYKIKIFN